jgi:hypothetical protein
MPEFYLYRNFSALSYLIDSTFSNDTLVKVLVGLISSPSYQLLSVKTFLKSSGLSKFGFLNCAVYSSWASLELRVRAYNWGSKMKRRRQLTPPATMP